MKKRTILGGVLVVIIGAGVIGSMGEEAAPVEEPKVEEAAAAEEPEAETKEEKPETKEDETGITKENYEKIKQGDALTGEGGMSKEEVIELFGEPDSKTESETDGMKMEFWSWTTKDFNIVSVDFMNGKVNGKTWSE